jgi:hypothetical protein
MRTELTCGCVAKIPAAEYEAAVKAGIWCPRHNRQAWPVLRFGDLPG